LDLRGLLLREGNGRKGKERGGEGQGKLRKRGWAEGKGRVGNSRGREKNPLFKMSAYGPNATTFCDCNGLLRRP